LTGSYLMKEVSSQESPIHHYLSYKALLSSVGFAGTLLAGILNLWL
jgi:hypothetical protein